MKHPTHFLLVLCLSLSSLVTIAQDYTQFMINNSTGCDSVITNFNNYSYYNSYQGVVNYYWYRNSNLFSTSFSPSFQTFQPGRHRIRLEARDTTGRNLGWYEQELMVLGPLPIKASTGNQACPNESVNFSFDMDAGFIDSAVWDFGPGIYKQGNWVEHRFPTPGNYTVSLTIFAGSPCYRAYSSQMVINVSNTAIPSVSAYVWSGWSVCVNDGVQLGTDGQYASYLWQLGDGTSSELRNPVHAYTSEGQKLITLTATNICGQSRTSDTLIVNVGIAQPANAEFHFYSGGNFCPGSQITFEAHGSGSYSWDFGDGSVSTLQRPIVAFGDTGNYPVRLIVTNGCGNSDTSTQWVNIQYNYETIYGSVEFYFDDLNNYLDTLKVCPGTLVKFRNVSNVNNVDFEWQIAGNTFSNQHDASYLFNEAGVFRVYLKAQNLCGSSMVREHTVIVDSGLMPEVQLHIFPNEICAGEKVYFSMTISMTTMLRPMYIILSLATDNQLAMCGQFRAS